MQSTPQSQEFKLLEFNNNFNETYMQVAELMAQHSKAQRKKVGAVLVTNSGILIPGINGTPSNWDNECEFNINNILVTKPEVIHAELNCILKAAKEGISVVGSVVYITLSPCEQCYAMLHQAGIRKVYYREQYREKEHLANSYKTARVPVIQIERK